MQVWLRLLIVWVMAVALPVQGIAGVSMAHCATSPERQTAAATAGHHRHAGPAHAAHHHAAATATTAAEMAVAKAAGGQSATTSLADLSQPKCSSCTSCSTGSALPCEMPRLPQTAAAPAVFAEPVVTIGTFVAEGPERPPRLGLV